MKLFKALAVMTILGSTVVSAQAENKSGETAKTMRAVPAAEFVTKANSANLFEIATSQLAAQRSNNPDVRDFARTMINDHSKSRQQLKRALVNSNSTAQVPNRFTAEHAMQYNALKNASAAEFDQMYIKMQRAAHDEAVELFTNYSSSGDDDALRNYASNALPALRAHNEHANNFNMRRSEASALPQ